MKFRNRPYLRTDILVLAAAGLIGGTLAMSHATAAQSASGRFGAERLAADTTVNNPPSPVKLTCSAFTGGGFVNWDILVQLAPDGTAVSASQSGDAYTTGVSAWSVERTDPPSITISNGGQSLQFQGSALMQAGIPNTPLSYSGGTTDTCSADFSFPNPQSPVIQLEPAS